jgi:PAS domain S-box-containing protein
MTRASFVLPFSSPKAATRKHAGGPIAADEVEAATTLLSELADVYLTHAQGEASRALDIGRVTLADDGPHADARYRALVEQMPAVVFMADLDQGVGEAYVSPQIEVALGFSQQEWLEDPIRWYQRIHPADRTRWSLEAAEMLLTGGTLRSAYRVIARDGRVLWFHCQAAMIRREDGSPWFIHGVGVEITDLKRAEHALQDERNLVSTILDTVGALVAVLDPQGRILRFNRACERASGRTFDAVRLLHFPDLFDVAEESSRFRTTFQQWCSGTAAGTQEGSWPTGTGERRIIAWSGTALRAEDGRVEYVIASGNDVTERKRLERALLEISGREQRRIGQDLHDGLGQHLTGTAFMSKALQQRLEDHGVPEAIEARKIVGLVNEAIEKTRELARGLVPVMSGEDGLMVSLQRFAGEIEDLFNVSCRFVCDTPVLMDDLAAATHLFHIAQEAVSNAIKHGRSRRLVIELSARDGIGRLAIEDDGSGTEMVGPGQRGMGLHIMRYRANMIGGSLQLRTEGPNLGTTVDCVFPMRARE